MIAHLIAAPVLLPAVVAALIMLFRRRTLRIGRSVSLASCLALVVIAALLMREASNGTVVSYALGDWHAPFGIILVVDRLSAMMLLLTSVLSLIVLGHVVATDLDRRGWHFHSLFHFQLLGLNGAFLTGDIFNLFVFFEVLLIASYGLMLHGQGADRLKAGVQYVIINLVGSTLFLIGIGILYGVTGTLNLADMAIRVPELPASDLGLLQAGALLLISVFALKAALLPLHLWLPRTYANAAPAVAALFAIMTKVGVYSIIRVVTLVFGAAAGSAAWAPAPWLLPAALLTTVIGFLGLIASRGLRELAAFALIGSTGTLLIAVTLFDTNAMAAALYYLPHTTIAAATLFLVTDLIIKRRDGGDRLIVGQRFAGSEPLSLLFILGAVALVGLPPLSGFIGKLLILEAAMPFASAPWVWATILITTFIGIVGLARAGSTLFWKPAAVGGEPNPPARAKRPAEFAAPALLLALLAALTLLAGPATSYAEAAAVQLFDPAAYVDSVLGGGG
ncbi:MAG TPA: monovalent cation/H+ antiporter subunit D [Sphingomicrobium sp.]|nr:monovalent cation/H+ antiporter subunit D [Sphingomicrobium sp.]